MSIISEVIAASNIKTELYNIIVSRLCEEDRQYELQHILACKIYALLADITCNIICHVLCEMKY